MNDNGKSKLIMGLKKHKGLIAIVCMVLIIIFNIIRLFSEARINLLDVDIKSISISDLDASIIKEIVIVIFASMLNFLPLVLIYFAITMSEKLYRKSKLSAEDYNKDKEYYRDILEEYSPAILSYIDQFDISNENVIPAILLSLKSRKKVDLNEDDSTILVDNIDDVSESDKYIVSNIENGKLSDINQFTFKNIIQNEAEKIGLIKKANFDISTLLKFILVFLGLLIIPLGIELNLFNQIVNNANVENFKIIAFIFIAIAMFFSIPILIIIVVRYLSKGLQNRYIRTEKGESLNKKLEGLKIYLKDFSNLDEKNIEDVVMWEEYLIYSVMFGQNKNISKKIIDKYINYPI